MNKTTGLPTGYVPANELLKLLFPHGGMCTYTAKGFVPHLKLGGRVLFDPVQVKIALERNFLRRAK